MRERCIPQPDNRARNVREIAKRAAGVIKAVVVKEIALKSRWDERDLCQMIEKSERKRFFQAFFDQ